MQKKRIFNEIRFLPEFEKELKKLSKKFRSIEEDLSIFEDTELNLYHKLGIDNNGIFQISGLGISHPLVYKAKKFACKALRGKGCQSGIRIIYAYYGDKDCVEYIEIYHKSDKKNEDRERIKKYYR